MEIFIILGLILINGFLSMCEMAVISSKKAKLEADEKKGNTSATATLKILNDPNNFLSTIQIGITLIGILTGIYSGKRFASDIAPAIAKIPAFSNNATAVSEVLIVIIVTYLSLVFGELVPKKIGLSNPEKIAKTIAKPMRHLAIICTPFVWLLSKSTIFFCKILNISSGENKVTEDEIKAIIQEGTDNGEIQEVEQNIVDRVFNLGDRNIGTIMTHRSELIWIDINDSIDVNKNKVKESLYNMYPVSNDDLDNILGVVQLKDLFGKIDKPNFKFEDVMQQPQYLPETLSVYDALEKLKEVRLRSSIVIDEFGSVLGIVTLKDIVEALLGDLPAVGEEQDIIVRDDGSILVDGQCSFYDFLAYYDMDYLYDENNYVTISGLILDKLEHIPTAGEKLSWLCFNMEILDMDGTRIDKVLVYKTEQQED